MLIYKKEGGNVDYLKDPLFLRQIIMDHYENPRNYEKGPFDDSVSIRKKSDSCIDDLSFELVFEDDRIKDISFSGHACTIASSSASIMTEMVKGKRIEEALKMMDEFDKMMRLEAYDENLMREANAFRNVGRQANRILCARLGWDALKELLKEQKDE